jgi:hypothetical protein
MLVALATPTQAMLDLIAATWPTRLILAWTRTSTAPGQWVATTPVLAMAARLPAAALAVHMVVMAVLATRSQATLALTAATWRTVPTHVLTLIW